MIYTVTEKKFVMAALSHIHKQTSNVKLKEIYADCFVRVEADHPSADPFIKILAEETLKAVDNTLASPVISEEVRVRAQTIKDAFTGIKAKLAKTKAGDLSK